MIRAGSVGRKIVDCHCGVDISSCKIPDHDFDWDHKGRNVISHIFVAYDEVVRSIQFGYLENGALVMSEKCGVKSEGSSFRVVRLDPKEFVTGLSGVVDGIGEMRYFSFHTNRGKYGPFGRSSDDDPGCSQVEIDAAIRDPREFGGFFGSYNGFNLTSIGMYVNTDGISDALVNP